jgi:hypothetical protein
MLIDAPVNDFPDFILSIESTILVREVFASMRDHIMWAQTSRVEDPLKFKVDEETDYTSEMREKMKALKEAGVRQDDYRLLMPIMAKTKFTIKISARNLVKIYLFFRQYAAFQDAELAVYKLLKKHNIENLVDIYHPISALHEIDNMDSGRVANMVTVSARAPFSLRTQIIRHKLVFVRDELLNMVISGAYRNVSLNTPMDISVSADIDIWRDIYSKRSCWLAQYSLWAPILNEVSKHMDLSDDDLPCADSICPFYADSMLRVDGKDPNPPCPIFVAKYNQQIDESTIERMKDMIEDDKRLPFWNHKVEILK